MSTSAGVASSGQKGFLLLRGEHSIEHVVTVRCAVFAHDSARGIVFDIDCKYQRPPTHPGVE